MYDNVYKTLMDAKIWCEVYPDFQFNALCDDTVGVTIDGDWKHEHLRAKCLLRDIGLEAIWEYSYPSDSDCYKADYVFAPKAFYDMLNPVCDKYVFD